MWLPDWLPALVFEDSCQVGTPCHQRFHINSGVNHTEICIDPFFMILHLFYYNALCQRNRFSFNRSVDCLHKKPFAPPYQPQGTSLCEDVNPRKTEKWDSNPVTRTKKSSEHLCVKCSPPFCHVGTVLQLHTYFADSTARIAIYSLQGRATSTFPLTFSNTVWRVIAQVSINSTW